MSEGAKRTPRLQLWRASFAAGIGHACHSTMHSVSLPSGFALFTLHPSLIHPSRSSLFPPSRLSRGFTLLELLVVIVIMGIAAGVVTLSVAPSADRLLNDEGKRMVALFRLAQEEARAQGRPIAWEADIQGYRFLTEDKVRDGADDPLRPRAWPVEVSGILAPQIVFGAEPLLPPARIRIDTEAGTRIFEMDAFGTLIVKR